MSSPRSVLVVGAGLAGARCAETLRAEGYDGELMLVGEEPFAALRASRALEGVPRRRSLRREICPAAERVLGRAAGSSWSSVSASRRVDRRAQDGDDQRRPCIRWDALVLATGRAGASASLRAPAGTHVLRTLADAIALRRELVPERGSPSSAAGSSAPRSRRPPQARSRRDAARGRLGSVRAGSRQRARRATRPAVPRPGRRSAHGDGRDRVPGSARWPSGRRRAPGRERRQVRRRPRRGWGRVRRTSSPPRSSRRLRLRRQCGRRGHWTERCRGGASESRGASSSWTRSPEQPPFFWSDQFGLRLQLVGDTTHADEIELEGSHDSSSRATVHRGGDSSPRWRRTSRPRWAA